MKYYIYLTTNTVDNKKYIGMRQVNIDDINKDKYLGSGKILKQAIKKYGRDAFTKEILCECTSKEELAEKEKYFISLYNAIKDPMFYNIHEGGFGGNTLAGKTNEEMLELKKHRSDVAKQRYNNCSPEEKEIMHQRLINIAHKGGEEFKKIGHTAEFKKQMHDKFTGVNNPMYGKKPPQSTIDKLKNSRHDWNKNKTFPNRQNKNKKVSTRHRTDPHTSKTKKKISEKMYKRYNSFPLIDKEIIACNTNNINDIFKVFNGINEVFDFIGKRTYSVERCLRHAIKQHKTYHSLYWFLSPSTIESTSYKDGSK